ncbi:PRC-barrel domain-containing protein [Jannaschia sp. 2305UL9-9]|uniref:PRC-barrel domain-containing protein n=1 Tax=Jannaschia sp. 2305UL9-9 TaxID=3121638 RepID=UPI003526E88F
MLRTTLLMAAMALPHAALADAHSDSPLADVSLEYGETYMATTLIGTRVHATEDDIDPMVQLPGGTVAEWDDIGEIGDLIIGVDGTLQAVVVDVGGFLGIGEREVALKWSALRGVREDDDPDEYFLGVTMPEGMLENAPELEREDPDGMR